MKENLSKVIAGVVGECEWEQILDLIEIPPDASAMDCGRSSG